MKLAIFGATGKTGRPLVEQALAAGHSVAALARDPAKLGMEHANLRVIKGDVLDANAVSEALRGVEPMAWDFVMNFARDNDLPIIVFDLFKPHNLRRVVLGDTVGTVVTG